MELQIWFLFSMCFVLCLSSSIINREEEYRKLDEDLGLIDPVNHTLFLKKQVVDAKVQANAEHDRAINAEKDKDRAEAKAQKYIILLVIHAYATMIEQEFPDIMKNDKLVPEKVWKETESFNRRLVIRMYRWNKIIAEGGRKKNEYVQLIINGIDEDFRRLHKITKVIDKESVEYKQFVLRFCDSIVKAIEYGNIIIAHGWSTTGIALVRLKDFEDKIVNRNMAVFYNALVASDLFEYGVELMKEGGLVSSETTNN